MKKPRFNFGAGAFCLVILIGFSASALAQDDPNEFNQIMGLSDVIAGTASGTCGWEIVAVRDGSAQQGSDGGQLTIKLNTCRIFQYQIERFPQIGGAGGTTDLKANDLIIVWDEDMGHGSEESYKNFSYTGTYLKIDESAYDDYLELSSTVSYTNWAVYHAQTAGTFTKGNEGTNEHEILHLQHNLMSFTKDDGIAPNDCVVPDQEITYTICWDNGSGQWVSEAYIIDWLPEGVTYPQGGYTIEFGDPNDPNQAPFNIIPPDPGYDAGTHSYVWPLDDIGPDASGCVQLAVVVNEKAVPGGILHNVAELYGTFMDPNGLPVSGLLARATKDTNVCCWGDYPDILYVDQNATAGNNTGLNWPNAFLDLQDALYYARFAVCGQVEKVYVAQGTYYPGDDESDTFKLPDGISVYGGFPTGGSPFEHRNPKRYKTTLSGRIDDTTRNDTVVTMGHETLLDGFTVTEAGPYPFGQGISGSGADFTVNNCRIENNEGYGLYAEDGNVLLAWCTIRNNKADGIRHTGEGFALIVENCWIRQSGQHGVYCLNSTPIVLNSILSESDMAREGRAGLLTANPASRPLLQNVTVAHNKTVGIWRVGGALPEIQNSIVYHNGDVPLMGFSADEAAWYSCIEDANSINYNINTDPQFAYFDPNNVRLSPVSLCRNASNPSMDYSGQLDMDAQPRVYGFAPDMGAYELTCDTNVSNEWDWNADGLVNLVEFAKFSRVWLAHDPNDPAISDPNHLNYEYLNDPNSPGYVTPSSIEKWYPHGHTFNYVTTGDSQYRIDLADLLYWLDEAPWLWKACWVSLDQMQMQQTMDGGEMLQMGTVISAQAEIQSVPEKTVLEQMADLAATIIQLENLWLTEPDIQQTINADDWQRFMEAVHENLLELQSGTIQIE